MQIKSSDRGQILLVVVLVTTVVLTISLSVLARSVVNSRLSSEEDQSVKALSAAEAGIEKTLLAGAANSSPVTFGNGAAFTTTNTQTTGSNFLLDNGRIIEKDEGTDIWLSLYANGNYTNQWSGTFNLYWGNGSDNCVNVTKPAAIEVLLISGPTNNPIATHYALDPCSSRANGFTQASSTNKTINGRTFQYNAQVPVVNGLLARIIPLYVNTYIGVDNNNAVNSDFPVQGVLIESTGTIGNIKRKVSLFQGNPSLPTELFMYTFLWPKKSN